MTTFLAVDLAVCLNDWCIDLPTGRHDAERAAALLAAYQAVRPLTVAERELPPWQRRRRAALLAVAPVGLYPLREASMLKPHDPAHFERVLRERIAPPLHMAHRPLGCAAP